MTIVLTFKVKKVFSLAFVYITETIIHIFVNVEKTCLDFITYL